MFVNKPKLEPDKELQVCDRVEIKTLPNLSEIVEASLQGEAVKAKAIAFRCNQFASIPIDVSLLGNLINGSVNDDQLKQLQQSFEPPEDNFYRNSAAKLTEAALAVITGISVYKVKK